MIKGCMNVEWTRNVVMTYQSLSNKKPPRREVEIRWASSVFHCNHWSHSTESDSSDINYLDRVSSLLTQCVCLPSCEKLGPRARKLLSVSFKDTAIPLPLAL